MDVSTLDDQRYAMPPPPRRGWTAVGHRLLTSLVLAGASTVPGGWGPGSWEECWAGRWNGCWTPAPDPAGAPDDLRGW